MTTKARTPIIHLVGPLHSGKTTLCRLFLDMFTEKSVLAVDASEDNYLTLSYGLYAPVTVGRLLQQIGTGAITREAIDWTLQDLPIEIPTESEAEILVWGQLPRPLSQSQQEFLAYGLPRLFQAYDIVLWDGPLEMVETLMTSIETKHLIVITPADEAYCQTVPWEQAMILLSKADASDGLPPTAAQQVQRGNWTFLGKLPPLSPPEKRIKELPQYFQDCFHKLDLPFTLRSLPDVG